MKAREERFIGNGNTWIGDDRRLRGWQITCSKCGAVKTVTSHSGSSPSPAIIVKKLAQSGWYIGHHPEEDICLACRRKPQAKKTNGDLPKSAQEITVASWGDYINDLRQCLVMIQVAMGAKQFNRADRLVHIALRGLERHREVHGMVWAEATKRAREQFDAERRDLVAAAMARIEQTSATIKDAGTATTPPVDDEYARWLAELDTGKEKGE